MGETLGQILGYGLIQTQPENVPKFTDSTRTNTNLTNAISSSLMSHITIREFSS